MSCRCADRISRKHRKILIVSLGILFLCYPMLGALADHRTDQKPYGMISGIVLEVCMEEQAETYAVGELTDGSVLTQSFAVHTKKPISGIRLSGATYMRENQGILQIRLLDTDNQKLIQTWEKDVSFMSDNEYFTLWLDEKRELYGKKCAVEIRGKGGWTGNAVTLYACKKDLYADGCLQLNGKRQAGDLCFQILGVTDKKSFWSVKIWIRVYVSAALIVLLYILHEKYEDSERNSGNEENS